MRWLLPPALLVLVAAGCAPVSASVPCDEDAECGDDAVCANHFCRALGKEAISGALDEDPCWVRAADMSDYDLVEVSEDGVLRAYLCGDGGSAPVADAGPDADVDKGRPPDAGPSDQPLPTPDAGAIPDGGDGRPPGSKPSFDAGEPPTDLPVDDGRACDAPDGGLLGYVALPDGGEAAFPLYDGGYRCPGDER